ncbi:MAG: hypothetical protein ACPF9T_06385, partial [Pseudomonadales bacterium]
RALARAPSAAQRPLLAGGHVDAHRCLGGALGGGALEALAPALGGRSLQSARFLSDPDGGLG